MQEAGSTIRALDLFCGAGGSSCGARMAGVEIVGGIYAWETAIATFRLNFPGAKTWQRQLDQVTARSIAREAGPVDLLLASPECTNHTFAKGNRRHGAQQETSRSTAFHVIRFAKALFPRWIVVENVVSMRRWQRYSHWKTSLERLGYHTVETVLDAQDFGVPQSRRRLFILCDRKAEPGLPAPGKVIKRTVRDVLHSGSCNGFSYRMTPLFGADRARRKARRRVLCARPTYTPLTAPGPLRDACLWAGGGPQR
jgi:DNA (cytosine-5)-methyltransferase 1